MTWFKFFSRQRETAAKTVPLMRVRERVLGRAHAIEPRAFGALLAGIGDRIDVTVPKADAETEKRAGATPIGSAGVVAVIPVHGTLVQRSMGMLDSLCGLTSYEGLRAQLAAAMADPNVREIVLDIDSPGGEVAGLFDLTDEIAAARATKPITAVVNELAASAAYAIAASASRIVAPRTAIVGSIGVVMTHVDQSGADTQAGYKVTHIHAGARKVDGTPHAPLSSEAEAGFRAEVDGLYELFVSSVARYRSLDPKAVRDTEARTYSAADALGLGLIDEIASVSQAMTSLLAEERDEDEPDEEAASENENEKTDEPADETDDEAPAEPSEDEERKEDAVAAERKRVASIASLGRTFGVDVGPFIEDGVSVEDARVLVTKKAADSEPQTISAVNPATPEAVDGLASAFQRINERKRR